MIVVENTAHTAGFLAVAQIKIFVAPGFENLVVAVINAVTGPLQGAMEMAGILQKGVIRSQVGATTEPPNRSGLEVAVIEMHRRHPGIAGVQHHRGADCKPTVAFGLRALVEDRRRQLGPLHLRKIDAPLLEDSALLHDAGAATAALRPLPTLLLKLALTIERLEPLTDRILQPHQ